MIDLSWLYHLAGLLPFEAMQARFMQQALTALLLLAPMTAVLGVQVVSFRLEFGLVDVVLVLPHADGFGIDLDKFRQRVQLLDSNDTSKDLCKSIKALSKLIYGYIDKHKERA